MSEETVETVETQEPSVEERARQQGWVPQDEWKGDPEQWRSAEDFVQRGEEIAPILKSQMKKLEASYARQARELAETKETIAAFQDWMPKAEKRMYDRAVKDVQARMDQAVEAGDVDAYKAAKADLSEVEKEAREAAKGPVGTAGAGQNRVAPEVSAWVDQNPWFNASATLNAYAQEQHEHLMRTKPGLSLSENLDEVTKSVKRKFPEMFGVDARKAPDVEGGGRQRGNGSARSYSALPPEAKAACDKFVAQGLMTKDEYVKNYEWD